MPEQLIANYINKKRIDAELTYEALATKSNTSESTVKNLCRGTTKNPGIETVMPIMEAVGGSYDEMLYPNKSRDEVKEISVLAMKDIYESQLTAIKESYDAQISNIRSHYEQHHNDLKENYEQRITDKVEHNNTLKKELKHTRILSWICIIVLVSLLIAEVANPSLGWLRY